MHCANFKNFIFISKLYKNLHNTTNLLRNRNPLTFCQKLTNIINFLLQMTPWEDWKEVTKLTSQYFSLPLFTRVLTGQTKNTCPNKTHNCDCSWSYQSIFFAQFIGNFVSFDHLVNWFFKGGFLNILCTQILILPSIYPLVVLTFASLIYC